MRRRLTYVQCMFVMPVMHEVNLSGLDLNLLPVLEALLRRRSVTRAAADVGLSQPAMSRALGRLREVLGDPLLVRGPGGLMLTPRAEALTPALAAALAEVKGIFLEPRFDPSAARRQIGLASTDVHTILLAPGIMRRLSAEAPNVDLRIEPVGPGLAARMAEGRVDLAFALATTALPPGAASEPLVDDQLVVVVRRGHPAAGRAWTLEDYGRFDHVGVSIQGGQGSDLDTRLAAAGLTRRMALVTPHFMAALSVVAATDLATTLPRSFALRFADALGLILLKAPFSDNDVPMIMVWSQARARDPMLAWFRALVREVAWAATK